MQNRLSRNASSDLGETVRLDVHPCVCAWCDRGADAIRDRDATRAALARVSLDRDDLAARLAEAEAALGRVREMAEDGIRDGRGQAPSLGRALLRALDGPTTPQDAPGGPPTGEQGEGVPQ